MMPAIPAVSLLAAMQRLLITLQLTLLPLLLSAMFRDRVTLLAAMRLLLITRFLTLPISFQRIFMGSC